MSEAITSLSDKEKETLRLLLAGHDAKSIATKLDLSVHTVNDRLRDVRRKLGVTSSREAARLLAQAEGEHPKFLAPTNFGIDETEMATHPTEGAHLRKRSNHRLWWLTGGCVMLLAIATTVLLSMNGADAPRESAPFANPTRVSTTAPKTADSARQAQNWLALTDRQNWSDSWREAGAMFRSQVSLERWTAAIVPVRKPLGAVTSRALATATQATSLPGVPKGDYMILEFQTNFATRKGAIETVVLAKEPGGWKVNGYFIR